MITGSKINPSSNTGNKIPGDGKGSTTTILSTGAVRITPVSTIGAI
jgi:hypothetical protein